MKKNIKVVFMGTPEFAKASLEELVLSKYNVISCFTNPDKPFGRGMKLKASPVKEFALSHNIAVYQPTKIRNNAEVIDILKKMKPDFLVVVAYGKILPKEVLDIPRLGAINVHGSLLPKYRGAAPMQWAIINGERKTGITTMFMDEGMDTGDMLLKEEIEISESDNLESIHNKLMVVGAKLLIKTLDGIIDGSITRTKQGDDATYAPMINREMTHIDFNKNAREIFNFIRGLSPVPGTFMMLQNGKKYKVFEVQTVEDSSIKNIDNGCIIKKEKGELWIKCSDGYIKVITIQPQNSRKMDVISFLAGNKFEDNDKFV